MIYDVPFRYQQAIDPSALSSVATTLHAIEQGLIDCRNAGVAPESDPAVTLLIRHLCAISPNKADGDLLRGACQRRVDELRLFPALLALSIRGVENDQMAKDRFHTDGRKALHKLADELDIRANEYEVKSHYGDISVAGHIALRAKTLEVTLTIGRLHEGREVAYRIPDGRTQYAGIQELLRSERFARRLTRELGLGGDGNVPAPPARFAA